MVWSRDETPYSPVNNDANMAIYKAYAERAVTLDRYILGGRLAEYKHYDMHAFIGSALLRSTSHLGWWWGIEVYAAGRLDLSISHSSFGIKLSH